MVPFRISRSQMFFEIGVLKTLAILTEEHLCWSLLLMLFLFIQKRLQHGCFLVNITKFLRLAFCMQQLLLTMVHYKYIGKKETSFRISLTIPAGIYLFKVKNQNIRTMYKFCSQLPVKKPERRQFLLLILSGFKRIS